MWILPMLIDWVRSKYIKLKNKIMKKFDKFHYMKCWQFYGNKWTPRGSKNIIGNSKQQRTINLHPDAGKDWRQEEKGMTEDEMVGWHHRLEGHGFEQVLGVGDGQGRLACCSPWGHKESDTTEWLKWTELKFMLLTYKC